MDRSVGYRSRMIPVLYFHGFASSPASAKIAALRPLLGPHGIELHAPDTNVPSFEELDFDAMVLLGIREARRIAARALVGSSLGALVALEVARRGGTALPLVLIAPALGVVDEWVASLPDGDPVTVFNYSRNAEASIHRAFFEGLARSRAGLQAPGSRVTVLMGRRDQTVPYDRVLEVWARWDDSGLLPRGSSFVTLEEGDHSLVGEAERIANAIVEAVA